MKNFNAKYEFFASANGQNGFKSYFDSIFNSRKYSKVFVLKGGPGTGKSTFMKKLAEFAKSNNLYYEIFRCSSDINSLDGVIIKGACASICVLDGTAPHERDARIPGAVDELINLGVGWSSEILESRRKEIEELNSKKSTCYNNAYSYLKNYSVFARNIKAEIETVYDFKNAQTVADKFLSKLLGLCNENSEIRLISAFSKDGYVRLPTLDNISSHSYSVYGKHGTDKIFITLLSDKLEKMGVKFTKFPSPLDENTVEAIYFDSTSSSIVSGGNGEIIFDTTEFLNKDDYMMIDKKTPVLEGSMKLYSALSKEEFEQASNYHFMLEEIYKSAVDFKIIDEIYENVLSKIKKILL